MAATQADIELVSAYLLRQAELARSDPAELFPLVMRDEETNAPLVLVPHQRLRFSFIHDHDISVVRNPTGTGKTFDIVDLILQILGETPNARIAVISSAEGQASKVVQAVAKYIEQSPELKLAFPELRPSSREGDPWTQTAITVERTSRARDPSLIACGYGGKLPGSRLTHVILDDMLNAENTGTAEGRQKLNKWVHSTVLTRRGNTDMKVIVTNVPWHPGEQSVESGDATDSGDLTFHLAKLGWPVLNMDIRGDVWFENTEWDSPLIRPTDNHRANDERGVHRLTEHDDPKYARMVGIELPRDTYEWRDEDDRVPLWPEVKPNPIIEKIRKETTSLAFEQNQMVRVRSDTSSAVKDAWIEACKKAARDWKPIPIRSTWAPGIPWSEPYPTVTGVDPAFSRKKTSDQCSIFTFAVYPNGYRRILSVRFGRWSPVMVINNIIEEIVRFNSICYVESNAAQVTLRDWALERNRSLPVRALMTTGEKWDFESGIESVLAELENAAWLIPNDGGAVEPEVAEAVRQALFFTRNRKQHTGDVLMSWWIARQGAKKCGFLRPDAVLQANPSPDGGESLFKMLNR
jgi:hypothetical protein